MVNLHSDESYGDDDNTSKDEENHTNDDIDEERQSTVSGTGRKGGGRGYGRD